MGGTFLEPPVTLHPSQLVRSPEQQMPALAHITFNTSLALGGHHQPERDNVTVSSSRQIAVQLDPVLAAPGIELTDGSGEFLECEEAPGNGQQLRRCCALPSRAIAAELAAAAAVATEFSSDFLEFEPAPSNGQQLERCCALPSRSIAAERAAAAAAATFAGNQHDVGKPSSQARQPPHLINAS